MKITKLLLFLALLGHCFSDECADEFQQLIKTQCENINSTCRFHEFNETCVATVNECSKGNGDQDFCEHILPSTFPQKKCIYDSLDSNCKPSDIFCSDFNNGIAGITFDPLKNRSLCDGFKASDDKKKCLVDSNGHCNEFSVSCNDATSCETNLIDYTNRCKQDGSGTCVSSEKRDCVSTVKNVYENECHELISLDSDKKCVYKESSGECSAVYTLCKFYTTQPTCNDNIPLIQKDNKYYYDLSRICKYDSQETGSEKCKPEYVDCESYTGDDKDICPNLKVSDSTTKRCVYDPTRTSGICKEDYLSCKLYNDLKTSKRREGCESVILDDPNKKCIYINETDKCIETEFFSTCEEYKGLDKYICESIINPTNHTKCYLEKDRTCKERMFNCTEVTTEEDCLYYAKPVDSRKKCVYSSGNCYEEYQRCEDLPPDEIGSCSSLYQSMHNGKDCYYDSEIRLCRTINKTCGRANDEDECNLIAQSGVSDPDKKVCQYNSGCEENYKYCSDYRGTDGPTCSGIKPYDDSGNKIDRAFKCTIQYNKVGCEKISKNCSEAGNDPILCSLISPNIRDNNIKYCAFINNSCTEQYKACENITSTDTTCTTNIPQNYLTEHCEVRGSKCVSKKTCKEFNSGINYNQYLCENIPNCTFSSSGVCQRKTTIDTCKDIKFKFLNDKNEEICQNIETNNPYTKCVLKEDKSGCEEIVIKPTSNNITQENSSRFFAKRIQHLIILLCLFI